MPIRDLIAIAVWARINSGNLYEYLSWDSISSWLAAWKAIKFWFHRGFPHGLVNQRPSNRPKVESKVDKFLTSFHQASKPILTPLAF